MVIVVEGASGSGKTTLIRELSKHFWIPVYRPFRDKMDDHAPGTTDSALAACKVPVNTWMEDLFSADLLANIETEGVILDRSMPSALAYEALGKGTGLTSVAKRWELLKLWSTRMKRANAKMVYVLAPSEVCQARSGRFDLRHIECEKAWISHYVQGSGLRAHDYNTDGNHPPMETRLENLLAFLKE